MTVKMLREVTSLLDTMFHGNCTYRTISETCRNGSSTKNYTFSHGAFRFTIIPTHHHFVLKTGMTLDGYRQSKREHKVYREAVDCGLGEYFAEIYGTVKYGKQIFFVCEYIEGIGECYSKYGSLFIGSQDSDYCDVSGYFLPENALEKLDEFFGDHGINDLHSGNFGFRDGHVVYTDYAGCSSDELDRAPAWAWD